MAILFGHGVGGLSLSEAGGNPALTGLNIDRATSSQQPGGNMGDKEVRFGIAGSALFADVSTASSDGAVNAMHDSFLPLSGGILLANMMVDEVIVGAPGSGLFGMLLFCVVTVFLAGLQPGLAGLGNAGPHGYSEILYAYTSAAATNGSAFAGLSTNSPF